MDFPTKTLTIMVGEGFDGDAVIAALKKAGFGATRV